jgi:hypothetical protein
VGTLKEYDSMPVLMPVAAVVILDILAYHFGVDSRDGFNR